MNTPEVAQGSVLNFCDNQNDNGLLPASIGATENLDYLIYHSNWGMAIEELNRVHPDTAFLEAVYEPLKRCSAFLDRERVAMGTVVRCGQSVRDRQDYQPICICR